MLERVWKKAKLSKEANDVIVATDNKKIWNFCKKNQFKVIMTSTNQAKAPRIRNFRSIALRSFQGE